MKRSAIVIVLLLAACDRGGGGLEVADAWARPTAPSAPAAAVYVTLTNSGDADETIVSGSVAGCAVTELHETVMQDDVMRMQELADGLVVPAGQTVTMEPGGIHVMCMSPEAQLVEGETVDVVLLTESGEELDLEVPIESR